MKTHNVLRSETALFSFVAVKKLGFYLELRRPLAEPAL